MLSRANNARNFRRIPSAIFGIFAALLAGIAHGEEPSLKVDLGRGAGSWRVKTEGGHTTIVVNSSGIGQLKVKRGDAPWPMLLNVQLRYDDKRGFSHLEGFTLTNSKASLHAFLGSEESEIRYLDGVERRDGPKPELKIAKAADAIEVTLPTAWLGDSYEFSLHWVDLYRQ